jgi:hypothetical protein
VEGKVTYMSADRLVDKVSNAPYYAVHVRVPESLVPGGNLRPGGHAGRGVHSDHVAQCPAAPADPVLGFLQRSMREQ